MVDTKCPDASKIEVIDNPFLSNVRNKKLSIKSLVHLVRHRFIKKVIIPEDPKAVVIDNTFLPNSRNKKFSISMLAHAVRGNFTRLEDIPAEIRAKVEEYNIKWSDNVAKQQRTPEPLPKGIKLSDLP